MNILAIETSSPVLSVAVSKGKASTEVNFKKGLHHSEHLIPLVDRALKKMKLKPQQVNGIICGNGPGSFTGLRIGLSAAKGLALGLGKKVTMISSLDLIAEHANIQDGRLLVVLDARRERVYTAIYDIRNGRVKKKVLKDSVITFDQLKKHLSGVTHASGDGLRTLENYDGGILKQKIIFLDEKVWYPRAIAAIDILKRSKKIKWVELPKLRPAYLRLSEPEERLRKTY